METISCLAVTRAVRLAALERSMRAFARQTWPRRELVVVHDGGAALQTSIESLAAGFPGCDIRVHGEAPGRPLGALRNASVERATGTLVCQWDDDDLYHPERLVEPVEHVAQVPQTRVAGVPEGYDACRADGHPAPSAE